MIYVFLGSNRYKEAIKFAKSRFSVIREVDTKYHWSEYYDVVNYLDNKVITTDSEEFLEKLAFYCDTINKNIEIEVYRDSKKLEMQSLLHYIVNSKTDIRGEIKWK